MKNRFCAFCFLLMGLLIVAGPAVADDEGTVAIGGEFLLKIRVPAGGKSVKERADAVTERLPVILGEPNLRPSDIRTVPQGRAAVKIMVKNHLLITVTPEDGKANQLTVPQQAQVWLKQLRKVLPRINAQPNPNNQQP